MKERKNDGKKEGRKSEKEANRCKRAVQSAPWLNILTHMSLEGSRFTQHPYRAYNAGKLHSWAILPCFKDAFINKFDFWKSLLPLPAFNHLTLSPPPVDSALPSLSLPLFAFHSADGRSSSTPASSTFTTSKQLPLPGVSLLFLS